MVEMKKSVTKRQVSWPPASLETQSGPLGAQLLAGLLNPAIFGCQETRPVLPMDRCCYDYFSLVGNKFEFLPEKKANQQYAVL